MAYTHSAAGRSWINATSWRVMAWLGVLLQAIALVAVLWLARWNGAWSIGIFLVLSIAFLVMKEHVPSFLSLLVVLAAVLNAGGWAWEWFQHWVWFDETIHTFSAFAVVAALVYRWWARDAIEGKGLAGFVFAAAAVGLGLGIVWEILEAFFLDLTWGDTISDLVCDTVGAALGGALAHWAIGQRHAAAGA